MKKRANEKINIVGKSLRYLSEFLEEISEKKFRAKQIIHWIYNKNIFEFDKMTNLPPELVKNLEKNFSIFIPKIINISKNDDEKVIKFSLELIDGYSIETVLIKNTICISTQVGCACNCAICRTALMGFKRNLEIDEIISQILVVKSKVKDCEIKNVVFMGMGEPLLNFKNLIDSIKLINDKLFFNIGMRKITVSTVGIVPQIYKLADLNMQLTLAISLHSSNNKLRDELIPLNKKHNIEDILISSKYYFEKTGRRVTFEYIMIKDITDNKKNGMELVRLFKNFDIHVNLINFNPFPSSNYKPSDSRRIRTFSQILESGNITCTIRNSAGGKILAGCGQLAQNITPKNKRGDKNE